MAVNKNTPTIKRGTMGAVISRPLNPLRESSSLNGSDQQIRELSNLERRFVQLNIFHSNYQSLIGDYFEPRKLVSKIRDTFMNIMDDAQVLCKQLADKSLLECKDFANLLLRTVRENKKSYCCASI